MNPRVITGLIESASPSFGDNAPRAGRVLIVGSAPKGPTIPTEIRDAQEAYRLFGDSTLARDIELALLGARYGAQVAGTRVEGRVIALRAKTDTPASVVLNDGTETPTFAS